MRIACTIVDPKEFRGLPKDEVDHALGKLDALSIRLCVGSSRVNEWTSEQLWRRTDKFGVERHGWGWLKCRNLREAELEAKYAAGLCRRYELKGWWVDAEAQWSGSGRYAKTPDPYGCLERYVEVFRREAPEGVALFYNGFSWSKTSDGRKLHDRDLIAKFDYWAPMNYGTSRAKIHKHWHRKVFKYPGAADTAPMIGCGRQVPRSTDVWGFWYDSPSAYGAKSLIRTSNLDWVSFYMGNGSKNQLLTGHRVHPAMVQCWDDLRAP